MDFHVFSPHHHGFSHGFSSIFPLFPRCLGRSSGPLGGRRRAALRQQLPQLCGGGLRLSEALLDLLQVMRQDVHLGDLVGAADDGMIEWYNAS